MWSKKTELELLKKVKDQSINFDAKITFITDDMSVRKSDITYVCSNKYKNIIRKFITDEILEIYIKKRKLSLEFGENGESYYRELILDKVLND